MGKAPVAVNRAALWHVACRLKRMQLGLFPPTCLLCGAAGEAGRDLCSGCYAELPRNVVACACCALPLAAAPEAAPVCGQCRRAPPAFDRSHAPLLYRPPVDHLIKQLKFDGRLVNARLLGALLAESLGPRSLPEGVVPVPLHPSRLRERGFNQALEIARPLAARLGLPLLQAVARVRPTTPQTGLDAAGRRSNVRGAFVVGPAFSLRRVAILDDVVTTGSTVQELARVLRAAGVQEIEIWACARTAP